MSHDDNVHHKWSWMMEWCKQEGLPPVNNVNWQAAEQAYDAAMDGLPAGSKPPAPSVTRAEDRPTSTKGELDNVLVELWRIKRQMHRICADPGATSGISNKAELASESLRHIIQHLTEMQ